MEKRILQVDVKEELKDCALVRCNLYVDGRAYQMFLPQEEYELLIEEKFFIRDGKTKDSANVLNTTNEFEEKEG